MLKWHKYLSASLFFSIEDLQAQLDALIDSDPTLEDNIGVEVLTFEAILTNMTSDDPNLNRFFEVITPQIIIWKNEQEFWISFQFHFPVRKRYNTLSSKLTLLAIPF